MDASAIGVIFTNFHEENVSELVRRRTIASIPFGGRYRLIDFPLSNMVNSGITTIGLVSNSNYSSLIDHIGSGKDWDLARKDGGIILLPPFSDENEKPYSTRLEALNGMYSFLTHRHEEFVVLSDSDHVCRMDLSAVIESHERKHADITLVTRHEVKGPTSNCMFITADGSDRVRDVEIVHRVREELEGDVSLNIMVVRRRFLIDLVTDSVAHGFTSFEQDVIAKQLGSLRIFRYDYKGYYASIDSVASYYKHSMELLDQDVRKELFSAHDIYTKVKDSAPSEYGSSATVKNSLVSDGCKIEGIVENSILFRGVHVGKGAVVKDSILMQDTVIEENADIHCVITDKNVVITNRRNIGGCETLPYYVQKGTML